MNCDSLREEFESLWKAGQQPVIEAYLERVVHSDRADLLTELLQIELWWMRDLAPSGDEYRRRFADYAYAVDGALAAYCATVVPSAEIEGKRFPPEGDQSSGDGAWKISFDGQETSFPSIGPYRILKLIGRGGMGQVYLANQTEPVKRRVAIKVIKSDTPSKEIIARFEAERQALAMMDHQNIARVLDAGITRDGRPYFAMELVKGIPLTAYCDKHQLSLDDRMKLFVQTCRAIQHAHQKGIVHRDLKPENVLVTLYDGSPVAKVIDFGLAKALHDTTSLTNRTLFTQHGQIMGTLAYMSPEQAEMNSLDVDTRTDVYSLGVIFYELLTGTTPISMERLRSEAFDRILALIRTEEAPKPSSRLSESGDKISGISSQRKTEPKRLSLILKGELDWIALKALEKDRTRRYDGPAALADDVQRYLDDEVVQASPPSFRYRVRKTIRKHKASVATAAGIAVLLLIGFLTTGTLWIRATAAEGQWKQEYANARTAEANERDARANAESQRDRAKESERIAVVAKKKAESDAARTNYFLAEARWNAGRAAEASKLLHAIPGRFREVEWFLARRRFLGSDMTLYGGQGSPNVLFGPNGDFIYAETSVELSTSTMIWDAASGTEYTPNLGIEAGEKILDFGLSKKSFRSIFTIGSDQEKRYFADPLITKLIVWDSQLRRIISEIAISEPTFVDCCISADGERICLSDSRGRITLLNASTRKHLWTTEVEFNAMIRTEFSCDDSKLLTLSTDETSLGGTVRAWDADSGQLIWEYEKQAVEAWVSPRGKHVAVWGDEGVELLNIANGVRQWTASGSVGSSATISHGPYGKASVSFSPEGEHLAIGSSDGEVVILNMQTGAQRRIISAHTGGVTSVCFSRDGQSIASAGLDKAIRLWNVGTGEERLALIGSSDPVVSLDFSPDGSRIVSSSSGLVIQVWDATTGMPSRVLFQSDRFPGRFTPTVSWDGSMIAMERDRQWILLDLVSGEEIVSLGENVEAAMFSEDSAQVAAVFVIDPGAEKKRFGCHLWSVATGDLLATHFPESMEIASHVSRYIASADLGKIAFCSEGNIRVWDLKADRVISLHGISQFSPAMPIFSPDGKTISAEAEISRGPIGMSWGVGVWDTATGEVTCQITDPSTSQFRCLAYSTDGALLSIGDNEQKITVCDSKTGRVIRKLTGHTSAIAGIAFTRDGQRIGSIDDQGVVKIWDNVTGEETSSFRGIDATSPGTQYRIMFSKDSRRLMISKNGSVVVWDGLESATRTTLDSQSEFITSATFNHDGTLVATGNAAGQVRILDRKEGIVIQEFDGRKNRVDSVAFSPDGNRIASANWGGTIKIWDAKTGAPLKSLKRDSRLLRHLLMDGQSCIRFSAGNGQIVSMVKGVPAIEIWDSRNGKRLSSLVSPLDILSQDKELLLNHSGQRLVTWSGTEAVVLNTENGSEIQRIERENIRCLCLSPDGELMAAAGDGGVMDVFSTATGKRVSSIEAPGAVDSLCFNSDGTFLCSAVSDVIFVWDTQNGALANKYRVDAISPDMTDGSITKFSSVIFAPHENSVVAVVGGGNELPGNVMMLWSQGSSVALLGHTKSINSVAFSHDGSKIVSGSSDCTVRIWDSKTGALIRTIDGDEGAVLNVASTVDDNKIVTLNKQGKLKAWDLDTGAETDVRGNLGLDSGNPLNDSGAFSGNGLVCATRAGEMFVERWNLDTGERLLSVDRKAVDVAFQFEEDASRRQSPDGRYELLISQNDLLLIDQKLINSPSEQSYRQFKAKPKLWWHAEEAAKAESSNNWYAVAFHRGLIRKTQPESMQARQFWASAHNRLLATDPALAVALATQLGLAGELASEVPPSSHSKATSSNAPERSPSDGASGIAPAPIVDPSF